MTPEAQRIAIAKACGWQHYHEGLWVPPGVSDFSEVECASLPDYLNDLNAMHEAVATFDDIVYSLFLTALAEVVGSTEADVCGVRKITEASAAQRAEAFLRARNLWIP